MDSKRSIRVLIILLVAVNIFMGVYMFYLNFSDKRITNENEYIKTLMEYRDIVIECDIPQYEAASFFPRKVNYETTSLTTYLKGLKGLVFEDLDQETITFIPDIDFSLEPKEENSMEALARTFIDSLPLDQDKYVLDSIFASSLNSYKLAFKFCEKETHIYNSYIDVYINKDRIERVEIGVIAYEMLDFEYVKPSVSIGNILVSNFVKEGQTSLVIKKIDSGYIFDKKADVFVYVYRVMYDNGKERFFSVINGNEIKD